MGSLYYKPSKPRNEIKHLALLLTVLFVFFLSANLSSASPIEVENYTWSGKSVSDNPVSSHFEIGDVFIDGPCSQAEVRNLLIIVQVLNNEAAGFGTLLIKERDTEAFATIFLEENESDFVGFHIRLPPNAMEETWR
jgi:hypothetical protein